jgi:predicted DNA-binding transcriptional regulator AlpA
MVAAKKARQSAKIKEIVNALTAVGYMKLDQQAKVLGLGRSTTWTLVRTSHKGSGLSAAIINRMLASPELPVPVRDKIIEYVRERLAGLHGHSANQCRRFAARLNVKIHPTATDLIMQMYTEDRSSK